MATVTDILGNQTIATAQALDASQFTIESDPIVANSATVPHVTVNAVGEGGYDYYSFTLTSATFVTFDIDHAGWDPDMKLYGSTHTWDIFDATPYGYIDPGSDSFLDPYLGLNLEAGTYYVQLGAYVGYLYPDTFQPFNAGYTLNISTGEPPSDVFNYNYDFTYTDGEYHHSGNGETVHERINFAISDGMKQDSLATQYSAFLKGLIAQGFGSDVNGDGVISFDIGQNHHNPTIEGTTINVTSYDNDLIVKSGSKTQVRDVATYFDIHNNDVRTYTSPTVTSDDGHDVINGFIVGQDTLTLNAGGNVNATNFAQFFAVTDTAAGDVITTVDATDNFEIDLVGVHETAAQLLNAGTFLFA